MGVARFTRVGILQTEEDCNIRTRCSVGTWEGNSVMSDQLPPQPPEIVPSLPRLPCLKNSDIRLGGCGELIDGSSGATFPPDDPLDNCFPDQYMRVLVVTWNMLEMKVSIVW